MKTPRIASALLFCFLLPAAAQGQDSTPAAAFRLSGDLTAAVAVYASDALHGPIPFEPVTASSGLHAALSFAPTYRALGLLDFSFTDSNLLSHADGTLLEDLYVSVNQFYADLNFADLFYLRAGKQRLKWGAGWVFNPSDPVNPPKNPTAARQTTEGVPALKAELITSVLSLAVFGTLYDRPEDFGVGGKLSSSALPGSDFALSAYSSRTGSWTAALNLSLAPLYSLPGWDTIQVWFEGGLYGAHRYPALAPVPEPTGPQHAFLVGSSGTIPLVRTALLVEYYHLSEGLRRGQEGDVFAALRVNPTEPTRLAALAARPGQVGRDYGFLSLTQSSITDSGHPVFDHIGLYGTALMNLTDRSVLVRHGITTSFVQGSAVNLSATWAAGGEASEFANLAPAASVELELKIYF